MSENGIKIVGMGAFGFWIFLATLVGCTTYCYLKTPQALVRDWAMKPSREEMLVKQLQDPLAMRLYALRASLNCLPTGTSSSTYQEIITAVVKQWADEVGVMKASAYHMGNKWDASQLPLNKEQKDALIEVSGGSR